MLSVVAELVELSLQMDGSSSVETLFTLKQTGSKSSVRDCIRASKTRKCFDPGDVKSLATFVCLSSCIVLQ